ncbi:MAG: choice-of-anchor D domain-containing protein [Burkholderiales bacterium]
MNVVTLKPLKRLIVAAFIGAFASFAAHADDPAGGAGLFSANCASSGCHNTSTPLTSNASKIYNARNTRAWIQSNINSNNSGMGRLSGMTAQQVADIAAYLGNTPTSLTFGSTAVGSTATAQQVTVYASLKSGYSLNALTFTTTGDFARAGGTCATTVATGQSCTVLVNFTPTASGTRTGALSIASNNTLTPIVIALSGTATGTVAPAPVASITPASLALGSVAIGATGTAQNVTVSNTGNAALSLSAITSSNAADFVIAGGTCSAGGSVAAGASCTVSMAFKPAAGATGARTGSLSIAHNGAGSPGAVSLSGTAMAAAAPVASLTASLAFGSVNVGTTSAAQTATLSNTGTAALTIGTLATGSTEFVINGGSCAAGASVAAGSSCTVSVALTPSAAGARSASLVITHNAAGSQSSTSLSGTGVALNPVIGVSPGTLSFSQTLNVTSAAQSVTVSNTGNAPLAISALTIGGAQASEFQLAAGSTCATGGSVAANGSCVVKLSFTPVALGARSGSLAITHNAAGSPSAVALNGIGTASPQPAISLNAATLTFASQTLGSTSASQTVTVSNSGAATLTFNALTLTGTAAADFTRAGTCAATGTLAAGATCTVAFTFTPGAFGARSATLSIGSDASNGAAVLSLAGTGAAVATPSVGLTPAALVFGNQTVGVASAARTATLTNSGSGPLSIASITATSGFGVTHNCGASLAAGASCILSASFTPTAASAFNGSVTVASNAAGSPHAVSLSGTGVAASPVLAWTPAVAAVNFGDAGVGATPVTQTLTLANQGPGAVTLQQMTLAGAQAADFSLGGTGTCAVNAALAQGATCTVALAFQPGAVGARSAALQLVSSGTNPPDIALGGNGTAAAQPGALAVPGAISLTASTGSAAAPTQTLNVQSTGSAVLRVTAMRVAVGSFTLDTTATGGCPAAPFDLMPGQTCAMSVGWSSTTATAEAGILEIDTNAAAAPVQVSIQAVRSAAVSAAPAMENAGAGGCSIANGLSLTDPTLLLLVFLAVCVLSWRFRSRR